MGSDILSFTASFCTSYTAVEWVHSALGEELTERQSSKGCSVWDYIWLVTGHPAVFLRAQS